MFVCNRSAEMDESQSEIESAGFLRRKIETYTGGQMDMLKVGKRERDWNVHHILLGMYNRDIAQEAL